MNEKLLKEVLEEIKLMNLQLDSLLCNLGLLGVCCELMDLREDIIGHDVNGRTSFTNISEIKWYLDKFYYECIKD